jgi:hypothetical protein
VSATAALRLASTADTMTASTLPRCRKQVLTVVKPVPQPGCAEHQCGRAHAENGDE